MRTRILSSAVVCLLMSNLASAAQKPAFTLYDQGTVGIIDYSKYGTFEGLGSSGYRYTITDPAGLKAAAGEGVFPNVTSVLRDPQYKKCKKQGLLNGSHWNFTDNDSYQLNFFKWATASEDPGVRQYNVALNLEKSGNLKQAIKAYHAIAVHFPKSVGMTYWDTPWYIAPVAIEKIRFILSEHPELGMRLVDASVQVKNSFDSDRKNDVFSINPGRLVKAKTGGSYTERGADLSKLKVIKTIGKGKVKLLQYENHHWQLTVDGKPYVIRGMDYSPNTVGLSPDFGTLDVSRDWMFADTNNNGIIDGPFEAWVDKNRNNRQDPEEKPVGDFQLMKDMGVNALRIYNHYNLNKDLLRTGYEKYNFMYVIGDFIGMYAVGSKAEWYHGTDYTNPEHKKNMLESVAQMVNEYKDEPYVLMWVLGNENNYATPGEEGKSSGSGCRARIQPEAYYQFVNEAAQLIKSLDPQQRPVAVCNGDILFLDVCAKNAPALDVFGVNAYRGEQGFGTLWTDVADAYDRPVMLTEYGCSAFHGQWDTKRADEGQAKYFRGNWRNIEDNFAGKGSGNALGGFLFEYVDEWWKANSDLPVKIQRQKPEWYAARSAIYKNLQPNTHDEVPQFGAPFLDGWSYEEWLGIAGQGDGMHSPFMRQLRPAYFELMKMWKKYK